MTAQTTFEVTKVDFTAEMAEVESDIIGFEPGLFGWEAVVLPTGPPHLLVTNWLGTLYLY